MCGFAGFINTYSGLSEPENHKSRTASLQMSLEVLSQMGDAIAHRGPDQSGEWLSDDLQLGFAHRRLSIVDISPAGKQPMVSHCGRYVMVYNGEVYNYKELAKELIAQKVTLKGTSDTEVVLQAIALWGLDATLEKMHGMFTFALYDIAIGTISFVRDRMGEKPLYIGSHSGQIVFASELKALQVLFDKSEGNKQSHIPSLSRPQLNRKAIALYLRHGYIPAPYSVYENIFKLPPANIISITIEQRQKLIDQPLGFLDAFESYWALDKKPVSYAANGYDTSDNAHDVAQQSKLSDILHSVVEREMFADVPLGAFLSGGVDSSMIVAVMQHLSQQKGQEPVRTFSIGFEQKKYNEAPFAAAVAKHLGTQHYEKIVTTTDAQAIIPKLATIYDEPFADSSQLPTILVSQLAREHVTVSLSGDGGDELFGGYERYQWAQTIWQKVSWMPVSVRKIMANMMRLLVVLNSSKAPSTIQNIAAKFERLASMLSAENRQFFYRTLISAGVDADQFVLGGHVGDHIGGQGQELEYILNQEQLKSEKFIHQMMYLDIHSYLPDDILTKVDRASMSVSLESRVPLLDHAVVEQAWLMRDKSLQTSLPAKQPLREILYQYVPKELIERPKKGFAVPLSEWLRGDLQSWAETLLDRDRLKQEGVFDADKTYQVWQDFKQGCAGSEHFIWSVLMFQLWHEKWYS